MWIDIRPSGTNAACSVVFCHLKTTKQRSYSDACPPLAGTAQNPLIDTKYRTKLSLGTPSLLLYCTVKLKLYLRN